MEPDNCECTCHQPIEPEAKCPPHTFGEGYYNVIGGSRVSRTQVCGVCGISQTSEVSKSTKVKGPTVKGLSSGERFSR